MEVVVTTGAVRSAKLQSNPYHQQTNIQIFTGRMPFLSPKQQCQSTEWMDTEWPAILDFNTARDDGGDSGACKPEHVRSCANFKSHHISFFYRPDALPAVQPTASKHWKFTN